jgi:PAS domain S-box-containing protein
MHRNRTLDPAADRLADYGLDAATVLESTTDCICILDREWRFVHLNRRAEQLIGLGRDLLGQDIWEAFPRPPGGVFEAACRKVMTERVAVRCEDYYPPLGIWFENNIHPCKGGIIVYFHDITALKRQEDALRHSEQQSRQQLAELEAIYDGAPIGLAVLSTDCRFLRLNERVAKMNGLPVARHLGRTLREILPQFADFFEALVRRIVDTGEPELNLEIEGETAAQPGLKRTWVEHWLPHKNAAGNVVFINVVVEDVTERKQLNAELRNRNAELEAVLDAVPAAVWIAEDPHCRIIRSNRAAAAMLRLPCNANASKSAPSPEAPQHFRVVKDGVELPPDQLPIQRAAATGEEVRDFEEDIVFDDGTVRHLYGNAAVLRDPSGNLRGAVGAFIDLTEMVAARQILARSRSELERIVAERTREISAANEQLRREKEFTELLLASTTEGVFAFDCELRYTLWNPAMVRISGLGAPQVLGRVATEVLPFLLGTEAEGVMRRVLLGQAGAVRDASFIVPETGRKGHYDCDYAPLRDTAGRVTGAVAILRDITERRSLEHQLHEVQKMEAIGQLTGGIAHDFNNLLTVVVGSVERIRNRAARDEEIGDLTAAALRAAERGSRLTAQLLAFARKQTLRPETVNIELLIRSFETMLKRALGETIELAISTERELWPCRVDPVQFETALLNLVLNARDAMPEGGELRIDMRKVQARADAGVQLGAESYVKISVADTGSGMAAETIERAFEPFYTTKEVGKGTGLGLSMVYGFVKQSGGHIGIESAPGAGTTVSLYLPRAEGKTTDQLNARQHRRLLGGAETILVAEDDADVREVISGMLSDLGYRVIETASGPEAIELMRSCRDVELLVTDMVMPGGMNGLELAREARRLRPHCAVLVLSGYAERVLSAQQARDEFPTLSKPLHYSSFAQTIRALLDARRFPD